MESRRGIRSLIPPGTLAGPETLVEEVAVDRIRPNQYQPRYRVRSEELAELTESIRTHGILQPLVVRRRGSELELIAGERRLEAAKQAGLTHVPVVVREATEREMLELALVENLQREDINAMEAAQAYRRLMEEFGLTQEQVGERVGKRRSTVANSLRLLALPPQIQESIRQGLIGEGHGKALAAVPDPKVQLRVWRRVIRRGLSVRETEALVTRVTTGVPRGTPRAAARPTALDPNLAELEDQLRRRLSARVRILPKGAGGTVEITYADDGDLDRIYWTIMG